MGVVYHAFDRQRQEEVALKTLRLLNPRTLLLFKQEFRGLVDVVHPNLVSLYELSTWNDVWFITMELIRGCNFLEYLGVTSVLANAETQTQSRTGPSDRSTDMSAPVRRPDLRATDDWTKLRDCLFQLVRGVAALHAAGKLHRDIKPSNVLLSTKGRLVLVDFGLITEIEPSGEKSPGVPPFRGTPEYLAPELIGPNRSGPTPATDWYSVGVMMYEALTGALPHEVAWPAWDAPSASPPRRPSSVVPGVPPLLDELCMDLLHLDPGSRPTASEILVRLGAQPPRAYDLASSGSGEAPGPSSVFVGRAEHLSRLRAAVDRSRREGPQVAVVSGPSGVGKTTLVRQFLAEAKRRDGALTFAGRCYDGESVPYKAVDALIDRVAEHLTLLDPATLARILPADFRLLAELFPVLERVPGPVAGAERRTEPEDLADRRQRAFAALRAVFCALSVSRPLVLFIDDLQWTDLDSGALLAQVLAPPGGPECLLILCRRSAETAAGDAPLPEFDSLMATGASFPPVEHLGIEPLSPGEAELLAQTLIATRQEHLPGELARAIAVESAGYPMFLQELARALPPLAAGLVPGRATLGQLLCARIDELGDSARSLLEAIVVAGRPVRMPIAVAAAGVISHDREAVAALRAASLVVVWGSAGSTRLEAAHDRIRKAVSDRLSEGATRSLHEGLARALEDQGESDLEALFEHHLRAGLRDRAAEYGVLAAEQAERALAFERAADLYQRAADLRADGAGAGELLGKSAAALANANRPTRAAERYMVAATVLEGREGPGRRARGLRRLAAEQLIKNGELSAGWRVMRGVLEQIPIAVPKSQLKAVLSGARSRLWFLLRRLRPGRRSRRLLSDAARERLDVLWAVSTSYSMVNVMLSDAFRGRHLLDVLRTGNTSEICRALAYEVAMETFLGGRFFDRNCQRLLDTVEALAKQTEDPYDEAWRQLALACVSITNGRLTDTVQHAELSERIFRERCPGSHWEQGTALIFLQQGLGCRGDLVALRRSQEEVIGAMAAGRKRFGIIEAYCISDGFLSWLAADQAEEAYAEASRLLAEQRAGGAAWPEGAYSGYDFYVLGAHVYLQIYRGRPELAWQSILAQWGDIKRSFFLTLRLFRTQMLFLRGRTAIALAAQRSRVGPVDGTRDGALETVRELLADASRMAKKLSQDSHPGAPSWAAVLRAGIAGVSGNLERAAAELTSAADGFHRREMHLYSQAARYLLSNLRPQAVDADRLRTEAEIWLKNQGVLRIDSFAATLCPGIAGA
jgi:serine/threonine protein kinase